MTEIDKYKDAWLSSNQTINKLEGIITTLESFHKAELAQIKEKHYLEIKILEEDKNRLRESFQSMTVLLADKEKEISKLRTEAVDMKSECESERNDAITQLEHLKKEFLNEKSRLIEDLNVKYSDEIKSIEKENNRLQNEVDSFKSILLEKEKETLTLFTELTELKSKSKRDEEDSVIRLELLNKEFLKEKSRLVEDIQKQSDLINSLKQQVQDNLSTSSSTIQKLQSEIEQNKTLMKSIKSENSLIIDSLNNQLSQQQIRFEALQNEMKVIKQHEDKLRSDSNRSGTEVDEIKRKLSSIQDKMRAIDADHLSEITRLKAVITNHEKRIWDITCAKDKISNEKLSLESRVREIENNNSAFSAALIDYNTKLELAKNDAEQAENKVRKLEGELKEMSMKISALEGSCRELRIDRDDAEMQSKKLKQSLSEREAAIVKVKTELSEVRSLLTSAESRLRDRECEYERAVVAAKSVPITTQMEALLAEKVEEVSRLTQIVQRECEERTQLLEELETFRAREDQKPQTTQQQQQWKSARGLKRASIVPDDSVYNPKIGVTSPTVPVGVPGRTTENSALVGKPLSSSVSADSKVALERRPTSEGDEDDVQMSADDIVWARQMARGKQGSGVGITGARPGRGRRAR